MTDHAALLEKALKKAGYSFTKPRQAVYEVLSTNEPLSMYELAKACPPEIDRSSVYRTIALFEKLGIVQRLQMGWKYKVELSNTYQNHHHHLSCTHCGAIIALPEDSELENRLSSLATSLGFKPSDHQIEVRGLCSNCLKN